MYDLETIKQMNREQARKARGKMPYVAKENADNGVLGMPNFGDYRPKGWKLVRQFFVDSSGWGSPGEPALTAPEFIARVRAGFGYALIEEGQFQVYIGEFKRIEP